VKNRNERVYVKTIREFFLTLVSVAFIVNVTGATLGMIKESIGRKPEVYTVYPAIIDTVGDVGSIIGSTATTKLALGVIRPSFSSIRQHLSEVFGAWTASIIMFTVYSMISSTLYGVAPLSNVLKFMAQISATNVLAASPMIFVAYAVAILTYRRGWDPDNFVIPIESSLADSVTTMSLFIALNLIV
jgi:mgtE-like transporter